MTRWCALYKVKAPHFGGCFSNHDFRKKDEDFFPEVEEVNKKVERTLEQRLK
jgi:hypothetical protein